MIHELNIMTNDGWVVTLVGDKDINPSDLGNVSSIIVQPKADHDARVASAYDSNILAGIQVQRREYRLSRPESWTCGG
jgi:hypothetical protein